MSHHMPGIDAVRMSTDAGDALPRKVREQMEGLFQVDFSQVRTHVGKQPTMIGASAFTQGEDIFFTPGAYRPETVEGVCLLAHELSHVVQQRTGRVRTISDLGPQLVLDMALEHEADQWGLWAAARIQSKRYRNGQVARQLRRLASRKLPDEAPTLAIQPALKKSPRPVTLGQLMNFYASIGSTWMGAFGKAETPTGYRAPRLSGMNISVHAIPGTNEARYVGMGIHESSSGFHAQRYKTYGDEGLAYCVEHGITNWTGYRRIYFIMPAALAQLNKQAEAQHLADHQIAYDRTFGLLEKVLKSLKSRGKVRGNFIPLPNHVATMFEQEMKRLKVKPQLLQYAKMGLHMNAWKAKYEELAKKSGQRDSKGWHTLTFK